MCTFPTMTRTVSKRRPKVESKILVRAYVKRKNDILRPDMTIMPIKSPGWSRLARDLGNVYASSTLRQMVQREDIKEALINYKSSTDVSYTPVRSRGRPPTSLLTLPQMNDRRPCKIKSRGHVIDDVSIRRKQLVLPKGYPNGNVSKEEPASDYTGDLKVSQSNLEVDPKIQQLQVRPNVDQMLAPGAQPVLPKVCPNKNTLKEEPESSQVAKNTDDEKLLLNVNYNAQHAEVNLKRIIDELSARRYPCKVHPSFVINEIISRRAEIVKHTGFYASQADPVWKRISDALGNKISPATVRRMADRKDVREMIDHKEGIATLSPENSPGRRNNVERDVIDALLQHRAEIVLPDGSYVSKENPVWFRIAKNLGTNFSAMTVCQIAERPEVRQRIIVVDEKRIDTTSAGNDVPRKRTKIDPQIAIDAILARKMEIVRSKQLYVPKEDPVWSRISDDLGNLIAPSTVYFMACRKDVRALLFQGDEKKNIRSLSTVEGEEDDTAETEQFRNEINKMVFEDTINKLLRTVDSTDGLVAEIKGLRTELQELRKDLQELRERENNNFGSQDQVILLD